MHRQRSMWLRASIATLILSSAVAAMPCSAVGTLAVGDAMLAKTTSARASTIKQILNRWQHVAVSKGYDAAVWRDMMAIQLSQTTDVGLANLAALSPLGGTGGGHSFEDFTNTLAADIATRYANANKAMTIEKAVSAKLGSLANDQVFTPIPGCRLVDTRNVGGPISAGTARQFYGWSLDPTYNFGTSQGGIAGQIGTVCPGVYFPSSQPTAALATITVVGPSAAGNFVVWSGVPSTPPTTSVLNWNNPGDIAANTTVIPFNVGRGTTGRDFGVFYNGPSGAAQVIVDIVGYFAENFATALDCVTETATGTINTGFTFINAASCPAGYTRTAIACETGTAAPAPNVVIAEVGFHGVGYCSFDNFSGAAVTTGGAVITRCCRVPGR